MRRHRRRDCRRRYIVSHGEARAPAENGDSGESSDSADEAESNQQDTAVEAQGATGESRRASPPATPRTPQGTPAATLRQQLGDRVAFSRSGQPAEAQPYIDEDELARREQMLLKMQKRRALIEGTAISSGANSAAADASAGANSGLAGAAAGASASLPATVTPREPWAPGEPLVVELSPLPPDMVRVATVEALAEGAKQTKDLVVAYTQVRSMRQPPDSVTWAMATRIMPMASYVDEALSPNGGATSTPSPWK